MELLKNTNRISDFAEVEVDVDTIAKALGVSAEEYIESVTGTTLSGISEQWVANKLNAKRILGEQLKWDVVAFHRLRKKIEVRNICLTAEISFAPSTARGKGRFFEESTFLDKLESIDSYVFVDLRDRLRTNPKLYEISSDEVLVLYRSGELNKKAAIGKTRFFKTFPFETYKLKP